MYQFDEKPTTLIDEASRSTIANIRSSEYAVLVGKNNCGKSYLLKTLAQEWGMRASYVGPARYNNFNVLGTYSLNRNKHSDRYNQFLNQQLHQQHNFDNSPISLQQAIAELNDSQRGSLAQIMKDLLGSDLQWKHTVANNSMSQQYVSCDGHNISYTSSGFRLIATLITCLLDEDFNEYLIDEPELGISPEAQGILADFLFEGSNRRRYFPHIKTLVMATHSTIFLDRSRITNNYRVEKVDNTITVSQLQSPQDFNRVQFFLLGNRLETLYLPSAIILVEGKCDEQFVRQVMNSRFPSSRISLMSVGGDGNISHTVHIAKQLLGDLQRSPYRDRIFVVLDKVHTSGLVSTLNSMGIPAENIVVWDRNGIEHVYPPQIIEEIFGSSAEVKIEGDRVLGKDGSYSKAELAILVSTRIRPDTKLHPEFESKFLKVLEKLL